jgi:beta-lactamase class A
MIRRRHLGLGAGSALAIGLLHRSGLAAASSSSASAPPPSVRPVSSAISQQLAGIEAQSGGRLGVAIADMGNGALYGHRAGEVFPLCSLFKLLAAAGVLSLVDAGQLRLNERIQFPREVLLDGSPIMRSYLRHGVTLGQACSAAVSWSDNTAGNLLLSVLGGPHGVTAYCQSIGDSVTRLDRGEPAVNTATPGDPQDSTRPAAILSDLLALLVGDKLSAGSRALLIGWMKDCRTGRSRIVAGLPAHWRFGDKTGLGGFGSTNDVGIAWPPAGPPLLIAAFLTGTKAGPAHRNATLAAVGGVLGSLRS